jgi:hypothetical protein
MSDLVPNLAELIAALHDGSDGAEVAGAFAADNVDAVRTALRAVLASWEQPEVTPEANLTDATTDPVE